MDTTWKINGIEKNRRKYSEPKTVTDNGHGCHLAGYAWPEFVPRRINEVGRIIHGACHQKRSKSHGEQLFGANKPGERGDIIAFKMDNSVNIKRVIGLPQEEVVIRAGFVFIANQANPQGGKLNEPYLAPGTVTGPDGEFLVPDGRYFVLGDNRGHSRDSRQLGCIPRKSILGKVTKIF